jgi:hydrogenase maturation factor
MSPGSLMLSTSASPLIRSSSLAITQFGRVNTFSLIYDTIRKAQPEIPIQVFGGHTHIRDLEVYDDLGIGLESGESDWEYSLT